MNTNEILAKIDNMIGIYKKQLEEETAFRAVAEKALAQLPEGIEIEKVSQHAYKADALIELKPTDLEGMISILQQIPGVRLAIVRDGCTTIIPTSNLSNAEFTEKNAEDIFPLILEFDNGDYGMEAKGIWWIVTPDGMTIKIECPIANPHTLARFRGKKSMAGGSVYIKDEGFSHRFHQSMRINWAAGSPEYYRRRTLYWQGSREPGQWDYRDVLNLSDNFN